MTYDTRIIGIDVACGLTVLGMFGTHIDAHIGMITPSNRLEPDTPSDAVSGRSSVLFAGPAGVSIATMSGRTGAMSGADLSGVRLRPTVRAFHVFVMGAAHSAWHQCRRDPPDVHRRHRCDGRKGARRG